MEIPFDLERHIAMKMEDDEKKSAEDALIPDGSSLPLVLIDLATVELINPMSDRVMNLASNSPIFTNTT